jgi:hypothetical protein
MESEATASISPSASGDSEYEGSVADAQSDGCVGEGEEEEEDSSHIEMMFQQCFPSHSSNAKKPMAAPASAGLAAPHHLEVVDLTDWETDRKQRPSEPPAPSRVTVEGLCLSHSLPCLTPRQRSKTLKKTTRTTFRPASHPSRTSGPFCFTFPLPLIPSLLRTVRDLHRGGYHVIDFTKFTLSSVPSSRSRLSHYDTRREKRSESQSKKRRSPSASTSATKRRRSYSKKRPKA